MFDKQGIDFLSTYVSIVFEITILLFLLLHKICFPEMWEFANTVVSNHFHSVKILLFSSARSRDFDGLIRIELPVSMYTTKTPIDMCRFNVRSST